MPLKMHSSEPFLSDVKPLDLQMGSYLFSSDSLALRDWFQVPGVFLILDSRGWWGLGRPVLLTPQRLGPQLLRKGLPAPARASW